VAQDPECPRRRPEEMFCLKSHSTDCIIANVMGYLFLLGGKLFLVGNELFYAAPYEGDIDCHRFKQAPPSAAPFHDCHLLRAAI
jgi:hypothetical protein